MGKTIARIEARIAQLQRQADALRAKEKAGVIERINVALKHYKIASEELEFEADGIGPKTAKRKGLNGQKPSRFKRKTVSRIRFRDQHGNEWTGHGRAPGWYKAALAAGKTPEDLAVS